MLERKPTRKELSECSNEVLYQFIDELCDLVLMVRGGVLIPESLSENLDLIFTEDQKQKLLKQRYQTAIKELNRIVSLRYAAAMSGAMRWENSQEARVDMKTIIKYS